MESFIEEERGKESESQPEIELPSSREEMVKALDAGTNVKRDELTQEEKDAVKKIASGYFGGSD